MWVWSRVRCYAEGGTHTGPHSTIHEKNTMTLEKTRSISVRFRRKNQQTGFYSVTLPSGKNVLIRDKDTFTVNSAEDIRLLERDPELEKC